MMHLTSCGALNHLWAGSSVLKRLKKEDEYKTLFKSLWFLRWFLRIYTACLMSLALVGIVQVFFSDIKNSTLGFNRKNSISVNLVSSPSSL